MEDPSGQAASGALLTALAKRGVTRTVPSWRVRRLARNVQLAAGLRPRPAPSAPRPLGEHGVAAIPTSPTGGGTYLRDRSLRFLLARQAVGPGETVNRETYRSGAAANNCMCPQLNDASKASFHPFGGTERIVSQSVG